MERRHATRLLSAAFLILGGSLALAGVDGRPRIDELRVDLNEDRSRARVSFRLRDAITENALERIQSGIEVEFRHRIRATTKREFWLMPRPELARTRVTTVAAYDSLTGRYTLTRRIEIHARHRKDEPPAEKNTRVTTSIEEMRNWMTVIDVPLYDPTEPFPERPLRIKVDSNLGRRYVMLIFPSTFGASAEVDLPE